MPDLRHGRRNTTARTATNPTPALPHRGRGQNGGRLDNGCRIALSLFEEHAAPVPTERLPPPWGRVGWGQQTNQRSFLNTHAKHQETEIHEPTIGYRRNAIYPPPSPPPGPTQNAVAFCVGTRPLRASPCGGGSSSARTSTFMPASAPETPPIYIHLSAQSVCKSPTTRRNP